MRRQYIDWTLSAEVSYKKIRIRVSLIQDSFYKNTLGDVYMWAKNPLAEVNSFL